MACSHGPARPASASVISDTVVTCAAILARPANAFVHFKLTVGTGHARQTNASVAHGLVQARGRSVARPAQTFVNVRLALEAGETSRTVALVGVDTVEAAGAVEARNEAAESPVRTLPSLPARTIRLPFRFHQQDTRSD